jgi:hypothetical protein
VAAAAAAMAMGAPAVSARQRGPSGPLRPCGAAAGALCRAARVCQARVCCWSASVRLQHCRDVHQTRLFLAPDAPPPCSCPTHAPACWPCSRSPARLSPHAHSLCRRCFAAAINARGQSRAQMQARGGWYRVRRTCACLWLMGGGAHTRCTQHPCRSVCRVACIASARDGAVDLARPCAQCRTPQGVLLLLRCSLVGRRTQPPQVCWWRSRPGQAFARQCASVLRARCVACLLYGVLAACVLPKPLQRCVCSPCSMQGVLACVVTACSAMLHARCNNAR